MLRSFCVPLIFFCAILSGCEKNSGPLEPVVTGTLLGKVSLYDNRGRLLKNCSNVRIELEGTTYFGLSDSDGNWSIQNIPTGTYPILFSKEGFVTHRDYSFSFVAGEPVRYWQTIKIFQPPLFTITLDAIDPPFDTYDTTSKQYIHHFGKIWGHSSSNTPDSIDVGMYVFFANHPDTNPSYSSLSTGEVIYSFDNPSGGILSFDASFDLTEFLNAGFKHGDIVYAVACPTLDVQEVFNIYTRSYFPGGYISSIRSNVLSTVLP